MGEKINHVKNRTYKNSARALMSGENQKYCTDSSVPLTLRLIIIECPSFIESRRHLGRHKNLGEVLGDGGPVEAGGALFLFLWDFQLFNRI